MDFPKPDRRIRSHSLWAAFWWGLMFLGFQACTTSDQTSRVPLQPAHPLFGTKSPRPNVASETEAIGVDPPVRTEDFCRRLGEFSPLLRVESFLASLEKIPFGEAQVKSAYWAAMSATLSQIKGLLIAQKQYSKLRYFRQFTARFGRWSDRENEVRFLLRALVQDPECEGPTLGFLLTEFLGAIDPLWLAQSSPVGREAGGEKRESGQGWRVWNRSFGLGLWLDLPEIFRGQVDLAQLASNILSEIRLASAEWTDETGGTTPEVQWVFYGEGLEPELNQRSGDFRKYVSFFNALAKGDSGPDHKKSIWWLGVGEALEKLLRDAAFSGRVVYQSRGWGLPLELHGARVALASPQPNYSIDLIQLFPWRLWIAPIRKALLNR